MSTVSFADQQLYRRLASMSGWKIADHFGCHYAGDFDPIGQGGFFYDSRDWVDHGYASVVEFWLDEDRLDNYNCPYILHVTTGTINKRSAEDTESAWRICGVESDDPDRQNIFAQIETMRSAWGIEPSDDEIFKRRYKLSEWSEWRIWRSVSSLLSQLGS